MAEFIRKAGGAWLPIAVAVASLLAGIVLRVLHAGSYPLWLDEAYSAFAADHDFSFIWRMVPQYETHPPVYYSMLRLWSFGAGDGLLARRMLGLACGVATLGAAGVAAGRIARLLGIEADDRQRLIAMAVALVALQPMMITMSQQVRPYPVMILVYALSLLPLFALQGAAMAGRRLSSAAIAGFFACEALMLWLHSLGPLFGLTMTLALAVAVLRRGLAARDWAWLIAGQIVVGLLYLPAFLIMLHQARTWVQSGWVQFDIHEVPGAILQIWLDWNRIASLVALLLAGLGAADLLSRLGGGRTLAILLLMTVLPVALSVILSATVSPVFLARTLSPTAIPALLLVALGLARAGRWVLGLILPFIIVGGSMAAIDREQAKQGPPQDWSGAIAWLAPRMAPGDTVWAYPNEGALPLAYALRDERRTMPLLQVPAPIPALAVPGFHPTGSMGAVSLYPAQIDALVRSPAGQRPPTIWLLRLSPQLYDKGDAMLHALERERVDVGEFRSRQIDLIGLRRKGALSAGATSGRPGVPPGSKSLAPVAPTQQAQP